MWDKRFEKTLRRYLPFLEDGEPLQEDAKLRDLGLDSMAIVELLGALETLYGVRFTEGALELATFSTPAKLWSVLVEMPDED